MEVKVEEAVLKIQEMVRKELGTKINLKVDWNMVPQKDSLIKMIDRLFARGLLFDEQSLTKGFKNSPKAKKKFNDLVSIISLGFTNKLNLSNNNSSTFYNITYSNQELKVLISEQFPEKMDGWSSKVDAVMGLNMIYEEIMFKVDLEIKEITNSMNTEFGSNCVIEADWGFLDYDNFKRADSRKRSFLISCLSGVVKKGVFGEGGLSETFKKDEFAKKYFADAITKIYIGFHPKNSSWFNRIDENTIECRMNIQYQWMMPPWGDRFLNLLIIEIRKQPWWEEMRQHYANVLQKAKNVLGFDLDCRVNWEFSNRDWFRELSEEEQAKVCLEIPKLLEIGLFDPKTGLVSRAIRKKLGPIIINSNISKMVIEPCEGQVERLVKQPIGMTGTGKFYDCQLQFVDHDKGLWLRYDRTKVGSMPGLYDLCNSIFHFPEEDDVLDEPLPEQLSAPSTVSVDDSFRGRLVRKILSNKKELDPQACKEFQTQESQLKQYKIGKKLGQGAFGFVSLCYKRNKGWVALKEMVCQNIEQSNLFLSECLRGMKLNHRNIVRYNDAFSVVDEDGDFKVYVEMDYYDIGDLDEFLKKYEIDEDLLLDFATQTIEGIEYIHEKELIHRDLKPKNTLIHVEDNQFVLSICDFGAAKTQESMNVGSIAGTLNYVAPEIMLQSNVATPASDIFSYGAILYFLLTKREKVFYMAVNKDYDRLVKELFEEISSLPYDNWMVYVDIISQCFILDPKKRPTATKVKEMLLALRN